jgi:hypothetical protein
MTVLNMALKKPTRREPGQALGRPAQPGHRLHKAERSRGRRRPLDAVERGGRSKTCSTPSIKGVIENEERLQCIEPVL